MTTLLVEKKISHYYGDIIRAMFIAIGIIMLFSLPSFTTLMGIPVLFSIMAIAVLGIAAGLTSPLQRGTLMLNIAVSLIGLVVFTSTGWFVSSRGMHSGITFLNQIVAVLFLIALYLSIKSLRGYEFNK